VRAERDNDDGRVYLIHYEALGGECSGVVKVSVPGAHGKPAVDDGQDFDSSEGCH